MSCLPGEFVALVTTGLSLPIGNGPALVDMSGVEPLNYFKNPSHTFNSSATGLLVVPHVQFGSGLSSRLLDANP